VRRDQGHDGTLGIVLGDNVDVFKFHRQILLNNEKEKMTACEIIWRRRRKVCIGGAGGIEQCEY